MFPFVVNYFTVERGIIKSVVEVIEQPNETATHVVASLREVLKMNNLEIKNLTSIGADNTNVNYGQHHSVFTLLKTDFPHLVKGQLFSIDLCFQKIIFFSFRKLFFSYSE